MRRIFLTGLLLVFVAGAYAQSSATVDFRADVMTSVKVGDSTALCLVGHVVFHHNGAVITCDSAIRYNDRLMDCYRNVVINKDSTFVYGDKADYNGALNEARVYSPLVKMVDKDATLYTYNFLFNTLTNVGRYSGGGTLSQKDNQMESAQGYYYSDKRELIAVNNVEMRSPEYILMSDSVEYNLDSEVARFNTLAYIWNDQDEFLTARRGLYDTKEDRYTFTDSSYVMTKTQEIWADTIVYHQKAKDAVLVKNIQIADDEQQALAFGDFAQYWGNERKALLTRNPVVASYDRDSVGNVDTVFMRSDSMFLYTVNRMAGDSALRGAKDSLPADPSARKPLDPETALAASGGPAGLRGNAKQDAGRSPDQQQPTDSLASRPEGAPSDSIQTEGAVPDSLQAAQPADSMARELTGEEMKRQQAEQQKKEKEEARKQKDAERAAKIKAKAQLAREKVQAQQKAWQEKDEARLRQELARRFARGKATAEDSLALLKLDSLHHHHNDSLSHADSTELAKPGLPPVADSLRQAVDADSAALARGDSLVRIVRAYYNVKIFRQDFQAVCDSLVGFSRDSTAHLYKSPILWNEQNQVTAQVVDIFTKNQAIEKAVFTGDPLMCSEVSPRYYNQVKGKVIEAYFRNGEVYRMDAKGNGQTYYYMEDGDSTDRYVNGFLVAECADIQFRFANKQLDEIAYFGKPDWKVFPMDKIPETQSLVMKGFKWEGARRPSRNDVFDRRVRPSQRSHFENLSKPLYPVTEAITKAREELKRNGWIDRVDRTITPEAREFVHSLGN